MCGIYGTTIHYSESQVRDKLIRTSFRGPDYMGQRTFSTEKDKITLGHNRLSIIDLDARSNQPFSYFDNIHIVFNGEIYNFKSLKQGLELKGYQFKTTSDTEVICAMYLEYGKKCVEYLNGMFAFVIYDANRQILFGAKDRLGQKPLYYQVNGEDFEFASQISSIQLFNKSLTISKRSIHEYLSWYSVPSPDSIFNEIKKLDDGHFFVFDLRTRKFMSEAYWDIDFLGSNKFTGSYENAQRELESLLTDAVQIRLFADVPVGIFLSGGVDSSLIGALAAHNSSKKVKTFAVKFNEEEYDESGYAEQVANHLGTEHHTIHCDYREGIDLIDNFSYYYDEPFADASAIPSMLLAKYTRKYVTVALSGDGGDEAFLGYHRYYWAKSKKNIYRIPKLIRDTLALSANRVPYKNNRLKTFSQYLQLQNIEQAYIKSMTNPDTTWLEEGESDMEYKEFKYLFHDHKNIYERLSDFDLKTYLTWDINTKVDRASMAYSLEARSPLLDYRVIEFAESLPTDFKFIDGNQKRILKEVLYKHVPKEIFDRPKSGFSMPLKIWFREELKDLVLDELSLNNLKTIPGIVPERVQTIINEHMKGSWDHYAMIWKLLVLKQWLTKNGAGISIN